MPKASPRRASSQRQNDAHAAAHDVETLSENEARYKSLVENTADWMWEMNLEGRHTYSNSKVENILGYSADEFAELSLDQLIHAEDLNDVAARLPSLVAEKRGWKGWVVRFRHKDGSYRHLESSAHPILDAKGAVRGFRGVDRDITDRKQAEHALQASEARLRALLGAVPDIIFRMSRDGQYLDFHASDETLLAFPSQQIIGHHLADMFEPNMSREALNHIATALDTQQPQRWEHQLVVRGKVHDFEARLVPSGPDEVIVMVRDITERTQLEREVVSIEERERIRIGRDLHDGLGQELTGISLGLQTLSQKLSREESPHLEAVRSLTNMVQKSISDTKRIARLLSPGFSESIGLSAALRALAGEINRHTGVRCRAHCSSNNDIRDSATGIHVYRIAQECINNALKHSGAGSIDLNFRRDEDSFILEVLDDGVGIPRERGRAEGMGLKSMRYRARMLHGRLEVTPRKEGGTRVLCSWPFQSEPSPSPS